MSTPLLANRIAVVYGGGGAIGGAAGREGARVFHARAQTLLGRLPKLEEVAAITAFVASDRAGPMTGTVMNLTCGSLTD